MSTMKRLLLVATIVVSCVGCDQATKSVAKTYLSETRTVSLLADGVRLQLKKNYGAFLGAGASLPAEWRFALFSLGVVVILAGLLAYVFLSPAVSPVVIAASALIVGGGLSNLIDRIALGGYVVDFISLGVGPVRTGIFNFADAYIMVGIVLWVFGDLAWQRISSTNRHSGSRR